MALGTHPDVRTDPHELCPFAILKRRGMVAIVDEKRNAITGWRPAPGVAEVSAA